MRCEELKAAVEGGSELRSEAWEHVDGCGRCREEFAHLRALRSSAPVPPAGLRDRVLEAAFPAPRRRFSWLPATAAAAVALAFGGGVLLGRDAERRNVADVNPVVVERVVVKEVEKPAKPDDRDLFLLGLALEQVYAKQVKVDYNGVTCQQISADPGVLKMVPYCPIAQKLEIALKERPDKVVLRK